MLKHDPGGILMRSFSTVQLSSSSRFDQSVSPVSQAKLQDPATGVGNPYKAASLTVKGISQYTASPIVEGVSSGSAPLAVSPGSSPYAGGLQQSAIASATKDATGKPFSVAPLPSYTSVQASFASNTNSVNQPPGAPSFSSSFVQTSVNPSPGNLTSVGFTFTSNTQTPSLTVTYAPEPDPLPNCDNDGIFPAGTLNCPVGFQPLLNSNGDEVGCGETTLFNEQTGIVSQGVTPKEVLSNLSRTPEYQEWYYGGCPVGTREIRTESGYYLCEGAFPLPGRG